MENQQKCSICEILGPESHAIKMSPRELEKLKYKKSDIQAGVLVSLATTTIMFNNPPGSADRPLWWVCNQCLTSRLTK